jgi:hypothetical protein
VLIAVSILGLRFTLIAMFAPKGDFTSRPGQTDLIVEHRSDEGRHAPSA